MLKQRRISDWGKELELQPEVIVEKKRSSIYWNIQNHRSYDKDENLKWNCSVIVVEIPLTSNLEPYILQYRKNSLWLLIEYKIKLVNATFLEICEENFILIERLTGGGRLLDLVQNTKHNRISYELSMGWNLS